MSRWSDWPCNLYDGVLNTYGYAVVSNLAKAGQSVYIHRYVWEAHNYPIPPGMEINHLCKVRHCIEWHHLECVTPKQNTHYSLPTHCSRGHERNGIGPCKICKLITLKARRDKYGRKDRGAVYPDLRLKDNRP